MSDDRSCKGLGCRGLTKQYFDGERLTKVLDGVTFEARSSCTSFIVGASGSGKSTLLAIVSGLLSADCGTVSLDGERLDRASQARWSAVRSRKIGIVLQQFPLLPALTVRENIAVPLQVLGQCGRDIAKAVRAASEHVGLGPLLDRYPRELSVGQKQRVGIARATVHQPSLLLCDEPTAALDREATLGVMQLLRDYASTSQSTVVIVTHDLSLIDERDPAWRMDNGWLRPWRQPRDGGQQA
mgnify:FL=1